MQSGIPILDHGLSSEHLEDLRRLRQLRVDLVKTQLSDLEQTKSDLESRDLIAAEKLELHALRETLVAKLADLEIRLSSPAIYTDEINFFLELAN